MTTELVDALSIIPKTQITCLDDGFVRLVDCMPRLTPKDYTIEYAIVRCARISYGLGLRDPVSDTKLLRYLFKNQHTSPFESIKFTFHIRCPKFVSIHLLRHRTANFNEFSQRYAELKEGSFYHPSKVDNGIRVASTSNKQSSVLMATSDELKAEVEKAEGLCQQLFETYSRLVKLGLAKEIARFCLPEAIYTELYFTMDLHNLLHFLQLRMDPHAQLETVVYAKAIYDLIAPLVPNVIDAFRDYRLEAMLLSKQEIVAIHDETPLESKSKSDQEDFDKKMKRLLSV